MSSTAAQVRVRLSADGVRDVVDAMRQVEREAKKTAKGVGVLGGAFKDFKSLLPTIGVATVVTGMTSIAKSAFVAADAIVDASKVAGISATEFSRLAYAAKQFDVELQPLAASIKKFQINLSSAGEDGKKAQDALAGLGLAAKDLQGLNFDKQLGIIADRFKAIEDPADQTRIAFELFGKAGTDMIPMLIAGSKGIAAMEVEADRLGITLQKSTVVGVERLDEAAKRLKATLQGKIQSWLGELSLAILGTGDKKLDEFNAKIRELKGQLTALQGLSSVLMGGAEGGERFDKIKSDLAEVIKQRQIYLDQQKVSAKVAEEAAAKESAAVQAQIEAAKAKLEAERTAEEGAKKAAAAAERRAAEAKQAAEAAKRAAEEQQRLDKSAAEERFEIEQQILKASGQGSEAKLRALDAELAKQREILALATGGVTEQDEAAIARVRSIEASRIKFEELSTQAGRSLEDLARVRTRIEQDVELGILSQYQGQQQLLAIEQERLQVLRDLAAQATAAAEASGDPEAIAAAEALNDQIRQVEVSVLHASDSFATLREGAEEALHGGLTDVLSNLQEFESVGDVFRSLASTVAGSLQRMASEMLATYIMTQLLKSAMGAFGGGGGGSGAALASRGIGPMKRGGLIGYAGGGAIDATPGGVLRGPGTGTSDSIAAITTTGKPLLVSSGEYVVRAAVVNRPGMLALLHDLNAGIIASRAELRRPPRYASGGVIEAASAAGIGASTPAAKQAGFAGVVGLEPGLVMKHLETEDFDRFLVRKLQRNSRALKSIVGG